MHSLPAHRMFEEVLDVPLLGRPLAWICLDCRVALDEGEPCPENRDHLRASVADAAGRRALLARVWGGGRPPPPAILEALLRRFELPWLGVPLGGLPLVSHDVAAAGLSGLAEGLAPALARSLQFAFEDSSHHAIVLRDARTTGFELVCRNQTRIRILPGHLRLGGFAGRTLVTARDPVTRMLLPFNVVSRSLVLPGDTVTLHSPVDEVLDRDLPTGLYRDRPPTLLLARAPVVLSVGRAAAARI